MLLFGVLAFAGCDATLEENQREQRAANALLSELAASRRQPQLPTTAPPPTQKKLSHVYKVTRSQGEKNEIWEESVFFGEGFCSVSINRTEKIYDFKKQRKYIVDHASKTYTDDSLFVLMSYKINEFRNRRMIASTYAKVGTPKPSGPLDPVGLESMFGLIDKENPSNVELLDKDGRITVASNGETWSEVELSDQDTMVSETESFDKFLSLDKMLHPLVRKKAVSSTKIPKKIAYRYYAGPEPTQVTLELSGSGPGKHPDLLVPPEYKRMFGENNPLKNILPYVLDSKSSIRRQSKEWYAAAVSSALKKSQPLDALLLATEYLLETGDMKAGNEMMKRIFADKPSDKDLQSYMSGQKFTDEATTQHSLGSLESIDRSALQHPYMIDIAIASGRLKLNDSAGAIKLLTGVLEKNPYIAGVYKDLGDIFYEGFDMNTAWSCWDAARLLAPDHPMLTPVTQLENDLASKMS